MELLNGQSVLIVSHFLINPFLNASSSSSLRKYLIDKRRQIIQIEFPFPESQEKNISILNFVWGKSTKKMNFHSIKHPNWIVYVYQVTVGVILIALQHKRFDLCVAFGNLACLMALPFRKLGIIKKLIYYSVDYTNQRFENRLLNKVFHFLDGIACDNADYVWVVSKPQIEQRLKNNPNIKNSNNFQIVPIGFRSKEIKILPFSKLKKENLVFVGTLKPSAGPQLIIKALPKIINTHPKVNISFIGGGEYEKYLKTLAKDLSVLKNVKFYGRIVEHKKVLRILTKSAIGLAPYIPERNSISLYSDPGKIKLYLLCGLPVVTTIVATSSSLISKNNAGTVAQPNAKSIAKSILNLLDDNNRLKNYRQNAINLSKQFDSDLIFQNALLES